METANHFTYTIRTDSKIMAALGLSTFTFDTLQEWVEYDNYWNLNYIKAGPDGSNFVTEGKSAVDIIQEILYNRPDDVDFQQKFMSFFQHTVTNGVATVEEKDNVHDETLSQWESTNYTPLDLAMDDDYITARNARGYTDDKAWRIVRMNDFRLDSRSDRESTEYKARKVFINDIKNGGPGYKFGITGGLKWSSMITFAIDTGVLCSGEVNFELRLYSSQRKDTEPVMSTEWMKIQNVGVDGLPIVAKDNQGRSIFDPEIANKPIVAQQDMYYNELTGKLESGTRQIMAIMATDCAAAILPDAGVDASPEEFLNSNGTGFRPGYGKAKVFRMNGGNWGQWTPEYAYTYDPDNENTDFKLLPVQNKSNTVAFNKGDIVSLSRIDGVWQPFPFGEGSITPEEVETVVDAWDFMYMATNGDHFFYTSANEYITYGDYETAFWNKYYLGLDSTNIPSTSNSHVQLTSFDFMHTSVGGTRSTGHGLYNTQIGIEADGSASEVSKNMPVITQPFFGCVFPGGYDEAMLNSTSTGWTSTNTEYLTSLAEGETAFAYDQGDQRADIFETGFSQLPADIALHRPSGHTDGSPISILTGLHTKFSKATVTEVDAYLKNENGVRYAWLHDDDDVDTAAITITPTNNKVVQFRPLSTELYASTELETYDPILVNSERGILAKNAWDYTGNRCPFNQDKVRSRTNAFGGIWVASEAEAIHWGYNKDVTNLASSSAAFPIYYWGVTFDWMASGPRPGGAMGIIGASCSVTAGNSITFNTDYIFGMQETFIPGENPATDWDQTFGGGNTYSSHNNTGLFVRVYTAWPKHLTVYDARYFAVFHFNHGAGDRVGDYSTTYKYYNGDEEISKVEWDGADDDFKSYNDGLYRVEQIVYEEADFREPTFGEADNLADGIIPPTGEIVYQDGTEDITPWRVYTDWNVNTKSRGLLLPINRAEPYTRRTIGIFSIVIEQAGDSYVVGDKFTTSGGNGTGAVVEVTAVDDAGGITDVSVTEPGYDFRPDDFFTQERLLDGTDDYNSAKTKLVGVTGEFNGGDARMYVTDGITVDRFLYDDISGPQKADPQVDGIRIIENAPFNVQTSDPEDPVLGQDTTTINITNKSDNNKYDCFFFYYNDISHVWMENNASVSQTPRVSEQYVELEITSE